MPGFCPRVLGSNLALHRADRVQQWTGKRHVDAGRRHGKPLVHDPWRFRARLRAAQTERAFRHDIPGARRGRRHLAVRETDRHRKTSRRRSRSHPA